MPTPSPHAQAVFDECMRQAAAIAATEDPPCGMYTSSVLRSLGMTFQGLMMAMSLAFAAITFAANSGASDSQFLVKMRSRMNLPFFIGSTIAYGSLIFIYQGAQMWSIILAYWFREVGFAIHYGAVFLKILSEVRYRPMLRLERISASSAENHRPSQSQRKSKNDDKSRASSKAPSTAATTAAAPSTQLASHHAWLRASNKLNQTRLNKSSLINFVYILLVPVAALSVWTAAFASLPPGSARRALCFAQPWPYAMEAVELMFIAFTLALCFRVIHKGGQSLRNYGPLFEIKLFKLLTVLLVNELVLSTIFYVLRHVSAVHASSDMMAVAHLLRDHLTITVNLTAIFIYKVAIRGLQVGGRTNVTPNKTAQTAPIVTSHNGSRSGARPSNSASVLTTSLSRHPEPETAGLLRSGHSLEIDEVTDATQCIEIAELKRELRRVQMQAEYYRVKAMRKDNPHLAGGGSESGPAPKKSTTDGRQKPQASAKSAKTSTPHRSGASVLDKVPPSKGRESESKRSSATTPTRKRTEL